MELRSSRRYTLNDYNSKSLFLNDKKKYFERMEMCCLSLGTVFCILSCVILTHIIYHITS